MKAILLATVTMLFAACASSEPTAVKPFRPSSTSPRYADQDEISRLQREARANFERERERQGMLASVGSGPARSNGDSAQVVSVRIASSEPASPKRARTNWSVAEARYAMEIGKKPSDLTAGERAAARY